ncbi:hypothetical protein FRB94_004631 [Tulasnella sp. JGI-2019a]|nr:hypothetical protein FRB94_004631 [Tulasnella sp. JGI-2019a]
MQPSTTAVPSNQDIEAVIQMATSARPAAAAPPRDTRTQLFVGNVRKPNIIILPKTNFFLN